MLSSFLLTFRLLEEFYKSNNNNKEILLSICKYFIRRFFRIYIPFVIVCSLIKFISLRFIGMYANSTKSWFSMISLQSTGFTPLWTIAPEIKYYFFIPIFTLLTYKMRKIKYIWIVSIILSCFLIQKYNLFNLNPKDFHLPLGYHFTTRFSVFYLGSVLAIIYHEAKDKTIFQFNIYVKFILGIINLMVFIKALKYGSSYYNKSLTENGSFFNASFYMAIILYF